MFLDSFEASAATPEWRFRARNGDVEWVTPLRVSHQVDLCGAFRVSETEYRWNTGSALRLLVTDGRWVAMLAEWIRTDGPSCAHTTFRMPQEADLCCNVASKNRLVLRAAGRGAKLFRLYHTVDGGDWMDSGGLLLPDGITENAVKITPYSGLRGFGTRHFSVFAMTEDQSDRIPGWHMEGLDRVEITDPNKVSRLSILSDGARLTLGVPGAEKTYAFFESEER